MTLTNDLEFLILENERLIHDVIKKYKFALKDSAFDYEDLYQESLVGFIEAYHTYDETKGVKFTTYVSNAMKNKLKQFISFKANQIKFPQEFIRIWSVANEYDLTESDLETISELTNLPTKVIARAMKWKDIKTTKSYNETAIGNDGDSYLKYESVGCTEDDLTGTVVEEFLGTLDEHVRKVVILRMDDLTHEEIGEIIETSRYKVIRILKTASESWGIFTFEGGIEND